MKLHQLRALVAIAEHGSINGAARALCVTQPAITKTMRELETEVGVALLIRNTWGLTITGEGQRLLARSRLIVHELERAEEDMAQLRGVRAGHLRIGVSPLAGLSMLPEAFARFRRAMPDVAVDFLELDSAQLLENLRNSRLDFALAAFQQQPDDSLVSCTELFSFSTAFSIRRSSPLAGSTSLAQLQDVEWLHSDASENYPRFLAVLFESHGLPPPRRITRCTSNLLFASLLLETDAVAPLSIASLQAKLTVGQLVPLPLSEKPPDLKLALMVREGAILTEPADYYLHCIRMLASQDEAA
ncbi:LysR substrate-binding domain-containing protein [Cupriavidus sp. 8B]